jgi:hypothetical protein
MRRIADVVSSARIKDGKILVWLKCLDCQELFAPSNPARWYQPLTLRTTVVEGNVLWAAIQGYTGKHTAIQGSILISLSPMRVLWQP